MWTAELNLYMATGLLQGDGGEENSLDLSLSKVFLFSFFKTPRLTGIHVGDIHPRDIPPASSSSNPLPLVCFCGNVNPISRLNVQYLKKEKEEKQPHSHT